MECRVHAIPLVRKKINRKKEEKKKDNGGASPVITKRLAFANH